MGTLALASIGFWPLLFLFLFFALICALLIFFILMQKGKGEGLAGLLGGVSAADGMGTPEAQKELSSYTVWLSTIFFLMCLVLTIVATRCGGPIEVQGPFGDQASPAPAAVPQEPEETPEPLTVDEPASPEVEAPVASPEPVVTIDLSDLLPPEPAVEAPAEMPEVDVQPVEAPETPVDEIIPAEPASPEGAVTP